MNPLEAVRDGSAPTPTSDAERIVSLDVLRGFALLGILTMNIGAFSMPAAAYFDPTVYGDLSGANGWVWRATHLLADMKFMAIFSMLFGAGIVLMSERCAAKGLPTAGLHYRRMGWLIVFGLLHAHLLWYADILYWYGMCGLVAYLFRNLRPRWLIFWGLVSIAVTSGLMLSAGLSVPYWPPEAVDAVVEGLQPPPEALAEEVAAYRGGWLDQMEHRVPKALEMEVNTFLFWAGWRVTGLMLLGMAFFKLGIFSAARSSAFYGGLAAVALFVGLPLVGYGMHRNFSTGWEAPGFFFLGLQYNYWGSLLVSLGWVGLVMMACRSQKLARLTAPLAAVGQTAFSNYILQTVLCTTLFYGHGFGLFGSLDRATQALVVLAIWAFQLTVSPLWLRRFRFGPLEWLWRSLAYRRRQAFVRTPSAAGGSAG